MPVLSLEVQAMYLPSGESGKLKFQPPSLVTYRCLPVATSHASQSKPQPYTVFPSAEKRKRSTKRKGSAVGGTGLRVATSRRQIVPLSVPKATTLPPG